MDKNLPSKQKSNDGNVDLFADFDPNEEVGLFDDFDPGSAAEPASSPESVPEIAPLGFELPQALQPGEAPPLFSSMAEADSFWEQQRFLTQVNQEAIDDPAGEPTPYEGVTFPIAANGKKTVDGLSVYGEAKPFSETLDGVSPKDRLYVEMLNNGNIDGEAAQLAQNEMVADEMNSIINVARNDIEMQSSESSYSFYDEPIPGVHDYFEGQTFDAGAEKVMADYESYLMNHRPEEWSVINSRKSADLSDITGRENAWGEQQQAKHFFEALMHQQSLINSKRRYMMKSGQLDSNMIAENAAGEDYVRKAIEEFIVSDHLDMKEMLESGDVRYPGVLEERRQAAQERAVRGVHYEWMSEMYPVSSNLEEAGKAVANRMAQWIPSMSKIPSTFDTNPEYTDIDRIVDWANNASRELNEGIYAPSPQTEGPIFREDGTVNPHAILPRTAETLADMALIVSSGGSLGSPGLVGSSYALMVADKHQEALDAGLTLTQARNYSQTSALAESMLELLSPQQMLVSKFKNGLTTDVLSRIANGKGARQEVNAFLKTFLKENAQELGQESSQFLADKGVKAMTNLIMEEKVFDTDLHANEVQEMLALTLLATSTATGGRMAMQGNLYNSSVQWAMKNEKRFNELLEGSTYSPEQKQQIIERVDEYKKIHKGLPEDLKEGQADEAANAIERKNRAKKEQGEVVVDETAAEMVGDPHQEEVDAANEEVHRALRPASDRWIEAQVMETMPEDVDHVIGAIDQNEGIDTDIIDRATEWAYDKWRLLRDSRWRKGAKEDVERVETVMDMLGMFLNEAESYKSWILSGRPTEVAPSQMEVIHKSETSEQVPQTPKQQQVEQPSEQLPVEKPDPPKKEKYVPPPKLKKEFDAIRRAMDKVSDGTKPGKVRKGDKVKVKGNVKEQEVVSTHDGGKFVKTNESDISIPVSKVQLLDAEGNVKKPKPRPKSVEKISDGEVIVVPSKFGDPVRYTHKGGKLHYTDSKGVEQVETPGATKQILESYVKNEDVKQEEARGRAKVAEGIDILASKLGARKDLDNPFQDKSALDGLIKIAEGIFEETGYQGKRLVDELKKRLKDVFGDSFDESSVDKVVDKLENIGQEKATPKPKSKPKPPPKPVKSKAKERKGSKTTRLNVRSSDLKAVYDRNRLYYQSISNEETLKAALKHLQNYSSISEAYSKLSDRSVAFAPSIAAEVQMARLLLHDHFEVELDNALSEDNREAADDFRARAKALRDAAVVSATGLGQGVQIMAYWKNRSPESIVFEMEGVRRDSNNKKLERAGITEEMVDEEIGVIVKEVEDLRRAVADTLAENAQLQKEIERVRKERTVDVDGPASEPGQSPKVKRTKDRVKRAKFRRKKAAQKFLNARGEFSASFIGLNTAQVEAIGEMALALVEEGYYRTQDIVQQIAIEIRKHGVAVDPEGIEAIVTKDEAVKVSQVEAVNEFEAGNETLLEDAVMVIRRSFVKPGDYTQKIEDELVTDLGLTRDQAERVSKIVAGEMNRAIEENAERILDQSLGDREIHRSERRRFLDNIVRLSEAGALDESQYRAAYLEKFGLLPDLSIEQTQRIKELSGLVAEEPVDSSRYAFAVKDLATYLRELMPKKKWQDPTNTMIAMMYASMLSGPTTSVLNVGSVEVNKRMQFFYDLVNIDAYVKNAKKFGVVRALATPWAAMISRHIGGVQGMWGDRAKGGPWAIFREIYARGSMDNKFIEQINKDKGLGLPDLERHKYGKHRFRGGYLNPFNWMKFSGRNLEAQDSIQRATIRDRAIAQVIEQKRSEKGKKLWSSVHDALSKENIDMDVIEQEIQEWIALSAKYGVERTQNQINIVRREMIDDAILRKEEVFGLKEEIADLAAQNAFTGDRHGAISALAGVISNITNMHPGVKFVSMPWLPFTRVVGNVAETMADMTPAYGLARAYGYGVTGLVQRAQDAGSGMALGQAFSPMRSIPKSSQVSERGTLAHNRQLGMAYFGTLAVTPLAALFALSDDEDDNMTERDFIVTGRRSHVTDWGSGNEILKPYTIRMNIGGKRVEWNYMNMIGPNIPLAVIGSYNDMVEDQKRIPKEDRENRLSLMLGSVKSSGGVLMDMSFVTGIQDLSEFTAGVTKGRSRQGELFDPEDDLVGHVTKTAIKKYGGAVASVLPQNWNFINQTEKLADPTQYSASEVKHIMYKLSGINNYADGLSPKYDVLGDEMKSYPGDQFISWDLYLEDYDKDPRWRLLSKYNAVPSTPTNQARNHTLSDGTNVHKKLEPEQYAEYVRRTGKTFSKGLMDITKNSKAMERFETMSKKQKRYNNRWYTEAQVVILEAYRKSREQALKSTLKDIKEGKL